MQALSEWSIVRKVSFNPVKTNKKCYTPVCDANDAGSRKACPWRIHTSVPKDSSGYFKIKRFVREYTCHMSVHQSNHRQATTSFVCNIIIPIVKSNLDLTSANIISEINDKFRISIT